LHVGGRQVLLCGTIVAAGAAPGSHPALAWQELPTHKNERAHMLWRTRDMVAPVWCSFGSPWPVCQGHPTSPAAN
jgi:hypothetical protein